MAIKLKSGSGFRVGGPTGIKRKLIRETIYKKDIKPHVKTIVDGVMPYKNFIRVKGKLTRLQQKAIWKGMKGKIKEEAGLITPAKRREIKAILKSFNTGDDGKSSTSAGKQANKQFDKKGEPILTEQQKKINVRLGRIGDKVAYLDRYNKQSNGRLTREDLRASTLMRVSKEHLGIKQEAGGFANDLSKNSKTSVSSPDNLDQKKSNSLGLGSSLGASPGRRPFGISPGKKPFL